MEGAKETVDVLAEYEEINNAFMDEEVLNDPDKMDKLIAVSYTHLTLPTKA